MRITNRLRGEKMMPDINISAFHDLKKSKVGVLTFAVVAVKRT